MPTLPFKLSPAIRNTIIAAILVTAVVLLLYGFTFQGNISGFFRIGSVLPFSPYLNPPDLIVYPDQIGYDGQQFLSIALDPFLQHSGTLDALDSPRYRYRRIFYPLLSYLLSFGNRHLIPYVMVALNCLAILLIVFISSLYLKRYQGQAWPALLTLCIPGVWMVLSLSTADLIASALLVATLYYYREGKPAYVAIALTAACFTRETTLLLWAAVIFISVWERQWKQLYYLASGLVPIIAWNVYVLFRVDAQSAPETGNFGYPFFGIAQKLYSFIAAGQTPKELLLETFFFLLIGIFVSILLLAKQT